MKVIKRDGREVEYNGDKVIGAIIKAMAEVEGFVDMDCAESIESIVRDNVEDSDQLSVEEIQDIVEVELMSHGYSGIAKAYILYRAKRAEERSSPMPPYKYLDEEFLKPYRAKKDSFISEYGRIVYKRTYARPLPEERRREDWWETVARVVDYSTDLEVLAMQKQKIAITPSKMAELREIAKTMYDHMFNMGLFPSGRSLWVGGSRASYEYALSNFNCSFISMDDLEKFGEMFFALMLGTGVGISVEREFVEKLPRINTDINVIHKDYTPVPRKQRLEHTEITQPAHNVIQINVGDSKYGWNRAMDFYLDIVSKSQYGDVDFVLINYDNVRPAGEPLKTFGGFASGHGNLKAMFEKINAIFSKLGGGWQHLKPIHVLDIATIIAENVVSGGVRRSALIVFTDPDETDVIEAKSDLYKQDAQGNWIENKDLLHRSLSNNTIKYYEKPSWKALKAHVETMRYTGEPGFDNMQNALKRRPDAVGFNPLTK